MRPYQKHFPVNWIDGMKINKGHFIAQDDAWKDALCDVGSLSTSPIRFGILPPSAAGEDSFNVKLSLDNQTTLRVSVLSCQAVTPGGIRISIPSLNNYTNSPDGVPAASFTLADSKAETSWRVILTVNPFEKQPAGDPDQSEDPPRSPYVLPVYTIKLVNENEFNQFDRHPYAIAIGKLSVQGGNVKLDQDYIPPCYSVSAVPDLVNLHSELDLFLSRLEVLCSQIVQKIFKRKQQNDISTLVQFLCDRIMLHLGQSITDMRWKIMHEPPAALFACIASLARVMKNSIDLRTGSGREEMLNYLTDWCELKQGELESMLSNLANIRFDNNDINDVIKKIIPFVKVTARLFETLSKLDFIGQREDSGYFVNEKKPQAMEEVKVAKRRFLG